MPLKDLRQEVYSRCHFQSSPQFILNVCKGEQNKFMKLQKIRHHFLILRQQ